MDKKNEKVPARNVMHNVAGEPARNASGPANTRPHDSLQRIGQKDGSHKVVITYAEDMAGVLKDDKEGLIKKIIHEQAEKELEKKNLFPEIKKNKLYMFLSIILLLLAFTAFIFFIFSKDINVVPIKSQFYPIVFNDQSFFIETVNLSKDKIIESILTEAKETELKRGGLEGIYLTKDKQVIGLRNFLNILKSNFPQLDRTLVSDNFLLGLVNGETKDFFILIKMRSFADIFNDVKNWENKMLYDLHSLFEIPINSNTSYLFTKDFKDGIIENKNARILYDKDGAIMIMYVFADDTSLIVANKADAVREVMFRLSSSQLKK